MIDAVSFSRLVLIKGRVAAPFMYLVLGAHVGVWATQLPRISHRWNLADVELGTLLGVVAVFSIMTSMILGRIIDRTNARLTSQIGMAAMAASFGLYSVTTDLFFLKLAIGALFGCSIGILDVIVNMSGVRFEVGSRMNVMTLLQAAFSLGAALTSGVSSFLFALGSDDIPILIGFSLLYLLCAAILNLMTMPDSEVDEAGKSDIRGPAALPVVSLAPILAVIAAAAMTFLGDGVNQGFAGVFFDRARNLSPQMISSAVFSFQAGSLLGRLVIGLVVAQKVSPRRALRWGLGGASVFYVLFAATGSFEWLSVVLYALVGVALSPVIPSAYSLVGALGGRSAGMYISWLTIASYGAFTLGPLIAGWLVSGAGIGSLVFIVGGAYLMALAVALIPMPLPEADLSRDDVP